MTDCLFCKIGTREIPCRKVYEDERGVGVSRHQSVAPVHFNAGTEAASAFACEVDDSHVALLGRMLCWQSRLATREGLENGFRTVDQTLVKVGGQGVSFAYTYSSAVAVSRAHGTARVNGKFSEGEITWVHLASGHLVDCLGMVFAGFWHQKIAQYRQRSGWRGGKVLRMPCALTMRQRSRLTRVADYRRRSKRKVTHQSVTEVEYIAAFATFLNWPSMRVLEHV